METLRRMFWDFVYFVEVLVSVVVHATYALNMFFRAVWSDFTPGPQHSARVAPVIEADESEVDCRETSNSIMMYSELNGHDLGYGGTFMKGHEEAPIVLVHGIFGFGSEKLGKLSYWGGAEKRGDRILAPNLGALTSLHDRACELFYYLKGGTVDYGEERSEKYGHSRYGHTYHQGHYPAWDSKHPVHFVGHSSGAQVIWVLQNMLADKAFPGHESSADWVLSVTALSGSLNGTTRVYYDGIRPEDGRSMKSFSLLQVLRVGVLVLEWLDIPLLKRYYDFGFDHYNLEWHKAGFTGLVNTLLNKTGPFAHANWVVPDLSLQSALQLNKKLKTFDKTFYFSYATRGTTKWFGLWTLPGSIFSTHPLLFIRSLQICLWRHPRDIPLPYDGYRDEDWQDNDGALNTISQMYPRLPCEHPHCDLGPDFDDLKDGRILQPGIWYYTTLFADHISFVINRERFGVHFDVLYDNIFQRCRKRLRPSMSSTDSPLQEKVQ
jgi:triacylglycerol esterase/lipase EstA (alpha/beta hydrolase family)